MRHPRYPAYKASGVEWLGEVPAGWGVKPLGFVVGFRGGATPDTGNPEYWDGLIPWVSPKDMKRPLISDSEDHVSPEALRNSPLAMIPQSAVLVVVRGMILAHTFPVALTAGAVTINQDMKALIANSDVQPQFLFWFLCGLGRALVSLADESAHGTRKLETAVLSRFPILLPPEPEQCAIAAYLDAEIAKIDALLAKKRSLIETLQEKRAALISRTVTRGLPPGAARAAGLAPQPRTKDSGIEWIGEVPEHWGTRRLRHISDCITVGVVVNPSSYVSEEGVPFLLGGDVREFGIDAVNCNRCPPEVSDGPLWKSRLTPGDLVVVRVGYPGVAAVVPPDLDGANCASMAIVRKHLRFYSQWLAYAFNSQVGRDQIDVVQYGAAQKQFNIGHAVDFAFPFPPLPEQRAIADYLDRETARIDALVAKVEEAIERLQEYRTALITAAVTGQIDVRANASSTRARPDSACPTRCEVPG